MDVEQEKEGGLLAQLPTVVLGILIILLAVTLAVADSSGTQSVPVEVRESHTVPLGLLNVGLTGIFGIIVGLTAFLVLGEYSDAQQALQSEAGDVEEIYRLAVPLPEPKKQQSRVSRLICSCGRKRGMASHGRSQDESTRRRPH